MKNIYMKKYTILMFSMSGFKEWEAGTVNRNYFILHEFLKRPDIEEIIMVNYLPHTLKRTLRVLFENQGFIARIYKPREKLTVISTAWNRFSERIFRYQINDLVKHAENLILWSYYPLDISYFDFVPNASVKIFDGVDNWTAHPAYSKFKYALAKNYKKILEKCDVIFTVSEDLKKNVFADSKMAHVAHNGIDLGRFKVISENVSLPEEINPKIVGYVGTIMQNRIDFDLVKYLAKNNPNASFVFIGPIWKNVDISTFKNSNVHFLGKKPYKEIPALMKKFDAAIIPHKITDLTRSMDPMKVYEYLAANVPIVSTQITMDASFKPYVEIGKSKEEFNALLQEVFKGQKRVNLPFRLLEEKSWGNIVDEMLKTDP